jgi:hypothetical protein
MVYLQTSRYTNNNAIIFGLRQVVIPFHHDNTKYILSETLAKQNPHHIFKAIKLTLMNPRL